MRNTKGYIKLLNRRIEKAIRQSATLRVNVSAHKLGTAFYLKESHDIIENSVTGAMAMIKASKNVFQRLYISDKQLEKEAIEVFKSHLLIATTHPVHKDNNFKYTIKVARANTKNVPIAISGVFDFRKTKFKGDQGNFSLLEFLESTANKTNA